MAGDWIKMRGGLFSSPKLIAMGRVLHESREFRDWLTPGGASPMNGQVVSDHALRCVTGALLCVTWSWSREYGKALPSGDCLLPMICLPDVDSIAGAPGVGNAMAAVGWAVESDDPDGVILPKFFIEHNVSMSQAEKQKAYRDRKRITQNVTSALPTDGNETVTREEKSITHTQATDLIAGTRLDTPEFRAAWGKYLLHILSARGRAINDIEAQTVLASISQTGAEKGVADIEFSILKGAKSLLDSSNDFQKPRNGTARKPVTTGGKQRFVDVTTYQGGGPTHD